MNQMMTYMKSNNTIYNYILSWIKTNRFHILAWCIFMVYESLAIFMATGISGHILNYILHYALNIALFYFHAQLILPASFKKPVHRLWLVPVSIIFELCLYLLISYFIDLLLANFTTVNSTTEVSFDQRFLFGSIWRAIYFIGFSSGYYFLKNYYRQRRTTEMLQKQALEQIIREKQMTIDLAQAKNAYLRAQINPHFLFNTLNFIYNQVRTTSPIGANAILLLSNIMRHAIELDEHSRLKPMAGEIQQTRNLIALWQLRQRVPTFIEFHADEITEQFSFIPLVLLTLTENIFKHGDLTKHDHPATISITYSAGLFEITTDNLVSEESHAIGLHSGLQNIKQRLAYAFGETARLEYSREADDHFKVVVKARFT